MRLPIILMLCCIVPIAGCATQARHPQCGRSPFIRCLGVDATQCDAMYDKAAAQCRTQIENSTVTSGMPERIRQSYTDRCLINALVKQSGKPEDEVKSCIQWD